MAAKQNCSVAVLRIDLDYVFHRVRVIEEGVALDADDHVVGSRFFYDLN